jgi:hypothetical protein
VSPAVTVSACLAVSSHRAGCGLTRAGAREPCACSLRDMWSRDVTVSLASNSAPITDTSGGSPVLQGGEETGGPRSGPECRTLAGFEAKAAVEWDRFAVETCRHNFRKYRCSRLTFMTS